MGAVEDALAELQAQQDAMRKGRPAPAASTRQTTPRPPAADRTSARPSGDFTSARAAAAEKVRDQEIAVGTPRKEAVAAGKEAKKDADEQLLETRATAGGEVVPTLYAEGPRALVDGVLGASRALWDAGLGRILPAPPEVAADTTRAIGDALVPQSFDTPYQAEERAKAEDRTGAQASNARKALADRLDSLVADGTMSREDAAVVLAGALKPELVIPMDDPDNRGAVSLFGLQTGPTDAAPVFGVSDEQAAVIARVPELAPAIRALDTAETKAAADKRARDAAAAIESPAAYTLRILGAPPSAVVGAGEAAFTDRTLAEAVPERIRQGEGFTGGGRDAGRVVGGTIGELEGSAVDAVLGNTEPAWAVTGREWGERIGAVEGGILGFGADLATPLDLGVSDVARFVTGARKTAAAGADAVTAGRSFDVPTKAEMPGRMGELTADADRAVNANLPRVIRPSALEQLVTSGLGIRADTARGRSLSEIRNQVGGIPELHAMNAKIIAKEQGIPMEDAGAYEIAIGLAEANPTAPGPAVIHGLGRTLAGKAVDPVTEAGIAEGLAARMKMIVDRGPYGSRTGTAARNAEEALVEARAVAAEELEFAREARAAGNVALAEKLEARATSAKRITDAEFVAQYKAKKLENYKADRELDYVDKVANYEVARDAAIRARSKADTWQHYGRVVEGLLSEAPTAGTAKKLEDIVEGVRMLVAPEKQIAAGDAGYVLGQSYIQAQTWRIVTEVVGDATDPAMAAIRMELELGPEEFLKAVAVGDPKLADSLLLASSLDQGAKFEKLIADRAMVAKRLVDFEAVTANAPTPVRKGWAFLQSTMGYGTPLIDEFGNPLVSQLVWQGVQYAGERAYTGYRSGMLGGFVVPSPKFFINNFATAPSIVFSTLGARYAAASVFSWDSVQVMRAMNGEPRFLQRVLVNAPDGTVYTAADLGRMVAANGISRSQPMVELGTRALDQLVTFGERAALPAWKSHARSIIGMAGDNFWSELANTSDTYFRVNVLAEALRRGETPADAVILARESLFDYGNLSSWEQGNFGKLVWFWSFRRNNYRAMFKNILTNPGRLVDIASFNNAISGSQPDPDGATQFMATSSLAENAPILAMINDPATGLRYSLNAPALPLVQAVEDLVGALGEMALMFDDVTQDTAGHGTQAAAFRVLDGGLSNLAPPMVAFLQWATGRDLSRGHDAGLSGKLDARIAAYLQEIPGAWETAVPLFDLVSVERKESREKPDLAQIPGRPGVNKTGAWEIGSESGKKNWIAVMTALAVSGSQRVLREYAPAVVGARDLAAAAGVADPARVVAPQLGNAGDITPLERLAVMLQLGTPTVQAPLERVSDRNRQAREREVLPP